MKTGRVLDFGLAPLAFLAAIPMLLIRKFSLRDIPLTRAVLGLCGYYPIRNHYYDPLFDCFHLRDFKQARKLPGIDLGLGGQEQLLRKFRAASEVRAALTAECVDLTNTNFGPGDADLWYQVVRYFRPRQIVEIGSGHSTRVAQAALRRNGAPFRHVCIEPYEMPWLEELDVEVLRHRVEDVDLEFFDALGEGDILFIDSSHIIRPQGDVLREVLQILPRLSSGVIVHFHDIFTPRDYPQDWLEQPRFWNEQYLLEAFLSSNDAWEVLLAANMVKHEFPDLMSSVCPLMSSDQEPGSFYMRRRM